jgi:predicted amidohydrolase
MNEKDIFQPGDSDLKVYDLGGFRIGMMICFDYLFPEPWRLLAEKGADLVCHPSNLLTENPRKCAPGLALMNRIYIATANRIGQERGLQFNGCSFFTSPEGVIGPMAAPDKEEVLYLPLDVARSANKMVTPRNHVFNDRRPDKYTG